MVPPSVQLRGSSNFVVWYFATQNILASYEKHIVVYLGSIRAGKDIELGRGGINIAYQRRSALLIKLCLGAFGKIFPWSAITLSTNCKCSSSLVILPEYS